MREIPIIMLNIKKKFMKTLNLKKLIIISIQLLFFVRFSVYSQVQDLGASVIANDRNVLLHLPNLSAINSTSLIVSCEFTKNFTENWATDKYIVAVGVIWATSPNSLTINNLNIKHEVYEDVWPNYFYDSHEGFYKEGTNKTM